MSALHLSTIQARAQIAALDRMRGKGQQKITVERFNVEPGGHAAIGVYEGC